MNEYFQENRRSLLLLTALIVVLLVVLYFMLLRPLTNDLSTRESAIEAKKTDIQLLEVQLEKMEEQISETDPEQLVMEKKIPTERKLDEYIVSLEQLENETNSQISQIEFMYDSSIAQMDIEDQEHEEVDENEESPVSEEVIQDKPEELQVITVRFTATSNTFNEFIELLEFIENEDRISIVSQLQFNQSDEEEIVSFDVHLTTFYYLK